MNNGRNFSNAKTSELQAFIILDLLLLGTAVDSEGKQNEQDSFALEGVYHPKGPRSTEILIYKAKLRRGTGKIQSIVGAQTRESIAYTLTSVRFTISGITETS